MQQQIQIDKAMMDKALTKKLSESIQRIAAQALVIDKLIDLLKKWEPKILDDKDKQLLMDIDLIREKCLH